MTAQQRLSRRTILAGTAASLAMPWPLRWAKAQPATLALNLPESAWKELAGKVSGGVIRPGDPRFLMLAKPENLRYFHPPGANGQPGEDSPSAVVRPRNAREVSNVIKWAQKTGCPIVPRSGGHSYAGCSTAPGLVVHSGAMRDVKLNRGSGLLETGGGVLNSDVFVALKNTERSIVHGRCGAVGLSAYLMGGGIGLAMREHGVGCDLAQSVELVLANGDIVRAGASGPDKDLFWAVRGGGGGNLAYATRWWLNSVPGPNVVAFAAKWETATPEIFTRLLRTLEKAPDQMGAQMALAITSPNGPWPNEIDLFGQFTGSMARFNEIMGTVLEHSINTIVELPYWDAQEFFEINAVPNYYQEISIFASEVTDRCVDESFAIARDFPGRGARGRLTFFLTGGKINTIKPDATAFVHRSSHWLINPILEWDEGFKVDDHLKWQRDALGRFAAILGDVQSYQNFPDPELADHEKAYWAGNLARLQHVKKRVDPKGVFTPPHNQGIPAF